MFNEETQKCYIPNKQNAVIHSSILEKLLTMCSDSEIVSTPPEIREKDGQKEIKINPHFQQTGPRNFTSEELYNVEQSDNNEHKSEYFEDVSTLNQSFENFNTNISNEITEIDHDDEEKIFLYASLDRINFDLNAIHNKPKLPFITIPEQNLRILIDSGASNSIMNPDTAQIHFKSHFFKKPFSVKSLAQTVTDDLNISYPILKDYRIGNNINFHIVQWHDRFDALSISNMSNIIETQLVIQYNNYMSIKLLNTLQSIERTISLASSGITNLEIISNTELFEIANHLKTIYKQSELVDWNMDHMFTILEFSKFQAVSVRDVITCILYIPILDQSFYQYSRIYPIPDSENKILIPPFKHHLQGARGEFWTDEQCKVFNNQTICVEAPRLAKCSIVNNDNCVYAIISNDYKLYAQLNDGKILLSCKFDLLITEECREEIQSISVRNNVLISSKTNCKIIIDNQIFENSANNVTFKNNLIVKDYKANRMINLQPKHLTDFDSLNEESESIIVPVNLHPLVHITQFFFYSSNYNHTLYCVDYYVCI
ncbi:hypothetical protein FQR65_LT08499 [Abscondita terminalis]|nr:hypothetical protein FQR65_LT08499 [Abscondita terminalis]